MQIHAQLMAITLSLLLGTVPFGVMAACTESPANTFACDTSDPNPDPVGIQQGTNDNNLTVLVEANAAINTYVNPGPDLDGIFVGDGNNMITILGTVIAEDTGIDIENGDTTLIVRGGYIKGITNYGIDNGEGNYTIEIINSTIESVDNTVLTGGEGRADYTVIGSTIAVLEASGLDDAISANDGDDTIYLENSVLRGGTSNGPAAFEGIGMRDGNDTLTIGNGVTIQTLRPGGVTDIGMIDCGGDEDTIIFAMDVPFSQLESVQAAIAAADPAGDTIEIYGETYQWVECENLVDETTGFAVAVPVNPWWAMLLLSGLMIVVTSVALRPHRSS